MRARQAGKDSRSARDVGRALAGTPSRGERPTPSRVRPPDLSARLSRWASRGHDLPPIPALVPGAEQRAGALGPAHRHSIGSHG